MNYKLLLSLLVFFSCQSLGAGTLEMVVRDEDSQVVPFRIHLKDGQGEAVRHPELPFHYDHFVSPGLLSYDLEAGEYQYEIEKGPEFEQISGMFVLEETGVTKVAHTLKRLTRMAERNWYSGDLHIHRPVEDVPLLVEAEDLNMGPVITWWNQKNLWEEEPLPEVTTHQFKGAHWYDVMAGEDEREGGALLYFQLKEPLEIGTDSREFPSSLAYLREAVRNRGVHVDIEKPFWWDVPAWVSTGEIDTIGLANNHMCRSQMYESEAWGFPRDGERLPAPKGNGYWTQEIYYALLNSGIRIPPSAGSASGVLPNPVGYNRVYVHVEGELTWGKWWSGLRAGRSFVTNGPLLEVTAEGELAGHVFHGSEEKRISITSGVISRDPVEVIEVIQNGKVVERLAGEELTNGKWSSEVTFRESGWFLVSALVENERTFRFASTAPYYVEMGEEPRRVSRVAVQFFEEWLERRIKRIEKHVKEEAELKEILPDFEQAREFWRKKREQVNAP